MSTIDNKDKTLSIALLEPKEVSSKAIQEYKASQVKLRLDQINAVDKIELHKMIRKSFSLICYSLL